MDTFETNIITRWLDRYGLVKSRIAQSSTGNGILYSAIFVMLMHPDPENPNFARDWFSSRVRDCFFKDGCLMRNPGNEFGQESWDDYLGVAAASLVTGDTTVPRAILRYGFPFFIFNTDGVLKFEDWLGRFVQVWVLMIAAAFPWIPKYFPTFLNFWLWLIGKFMKVNIADSSGTELEWVYMTSYARLMNSFNDVNSLPYLWRMNLSMADEMKTYYDANHPFIQRFAELDKNWG